MALTWDELESTTRDYFMADNGKAVDIYFYTSFLLNYLLKQQKGLWERPPGGMKIRVPLEYDGQEAMFYSKGDALNSDDRESLNAAYFDWKHAAGNATIYRIDSMKQMGDYGEIQLLQQRVAGAQKSLTHLLAGSIYDEAGGDTKRLTGFLACCNETTTTAYGDIQEADLVSEDGTTPWEGKRDTDADSISLDLIRTMCTAAKVRDGNGGKPDLVVTTETLWNVIASVLQLQQRFTSDKKTAHAGFVGIEIEGKTFFPDDYCPSGYMFVINTNHVGFAVHPEGYFGRTPWDRIPDSPMDKTMKILFDGNMVVNNRKSHKAHSNLT